MQISSLEEFEKVLRGEEPVEIDGKAYLVTLEAIAPAGLLSSIAKLVPQELLQEPEGKVADLPEEVVADEQQEPIEENNILGKAAKVRISSIPGSQELNGIVDTGATICSLHTDQYKINSGRNKVTFLCKALSPHFVTMDMQQPIQVRNADGMESRPVIKLNLDINGQQLNDVLVNLNDRSILSQPFLVGLNALEQGKFHVDPSLDSDQQAEPV